MHVSGGPPVDILCTFSTTTYSKDQERLSCVLNIYLDKHVVVGTKKERYNSLRVTRIYHLINYRRRRFVLIRLLRLAVLVRLAFLVRLRLRLPPLISSSPRKNIPLSCGPRSLL